HRRPEHEPPVHPCPGCSVLPFACPAKSRFVRWDCEAYTSLPMRVVVIIPAAGLGTRMAAQSGVRPGQTTKQFAEIAGKPILLHTLEKFSQVSEVSDIYIAVRENEAERLRDFLAGQRLRPKMHVLVGGDHRQHSVANALATVKADAHDVVLVHDAVRPFVDSEIIENVIEAAAQDGFIGTDEASLVERAGYDVAVVMGSPRNIKITTPSDMELAEFYAKQLHHGDRKNRVIR